MTAASLIRLLALSAIWGASFLFMRLGAPVLGPTLLIACRVLFAALFLAVVGAVWRKPLDLRRNAWHYLVLGGFNSALPFLLFAFAARTLSASLMAILNATAPIWGALIGAAWTRSALPARSLAGLALGVGGVALLVGFDPGSWRDGAPLAIALAVLALGVVCSGIAYLLYFRLIADLGAASALTVTFLVPLFGVLWGHLFLGEPIGWNTLVGALVVIVGTALVTGFSAAALFKRPAAAG